MERYKKVIIPLGLNEADECAICWGARITQLAGTSQVIFIHDIELPEIPSKALKKYPWLSEPLDEPNLNKMKDLVAKFWNGNPSTELVYKVSKNSSPLLDILQEQLDQESDLIVVGREAFGHDLAIRLARKASCSVMSVPKDCAVNLDSILVPTDFSSHSKSAFDVALAFVEAEGLSHLDALHVYTLGQMSHRAAIPEKEMINMSEDFANEQFTELLKQVDSRGIEVRTHLAASSAIAFAIIDFAKSINSSLIVASTRGKDTVSALLLGSNIEELLKHAPMPVIAAKEKGTGKSFLANLLSA